MPPSTRMRMLPMSGSSRRPAAPPALLVNVPATIAVFRAYLAELRGDAEGAASFAAQALAAIGEDERMLDFITQGAPGYSRVARRPAGRV
jgi:hypothetical protein